MKFPRTRSPNVQVLFEQGDVQALAEATRLHDVRRDHQGHADDRGSRVRRDAVLALGRLGAEAGNGAVAAALEDPVDSVRTAAVQVLSERGDVTELARALHWLPAGRGTSRRLAAQAVLEQRTPEAAGIAAAALVRAPGEEPLSGTDNDFIHALADPMGSRKPVDGVVRELLTALADERGAVADRAEELLVQLAPASTQAVVDELKNDASPERAIAVLTAIGDATSVRGLIEALERDSPDLRVQAAAALGWLRHLDAVEPLLQATRDQDPDVRAEASQALDRMGTAAVIVGTSALLKPVIADAVRPASAPTRPESNSA
jgi:HEAT repeat protein